MIEQVVARPALAVSPPLMVRAALDRFIAALKPGCAGPFDPDDHRAVRRRAVMGFLRRAAELEDVDSVATFERVLNRCLDLGFRTQPLAAFVFDVLQRRLAARVRRRLLAAGAPTDEVADLVSAAFETIQKLIRDADRVEHSLRYALLVSIADHRAIDFLRRRRPEYLESMDDGLTSAQELCAHQADPEARVSQKQRLGLARRLGEAVLAAVNELSSVERAALILVEVEGAGYPEVATRLGLKATDVGNVVRRARLARDRALVPKLREIPGLEGHVGFGAIQSDRALRVQMLKWSADFGAGICKHCLATHFHLHWADEPCPPQAQPPSLH